MAELDARLRAIDHLSQLAALASGRAAAREAPGMTTNPRRSSLGAPDGSNEEEENDRLMTTDEEDGSPIGGSGGGPMGMMGVEAPRARKGADAPGARPGFERLAARAAALVSAADELAGVEAAGRAWEGVEALTNASFADVAATARGGGVLRRVAAALPRLTTAGRSSLAARRVDAAESTTQTPDDDDDDDAGDPTAACEALDAALEARLRATAAEMSTASSSGDDAGERTWRVASSQDARAAAFALVAHSAVEHERSAYRSLGVLPNAASSSFSSSSDVVASTGETLRRLLAGGDSEAVAAEVLRHDAAGVATSSTARLVAARLASTALRAALTGGVPGVHSAAREAPWLAAALGRWHAAHAAMGAALRNDKVHLPPSVVEAAVDRCTTRRGPRRERAGGIGGVPPEARTPSHFVSPWAAHAVAAVAAVVGVLGPKAARALAASTRGDGGLNVGGSDAAAVSDVAPALYLLADRVARTAATVANWVTHQHRLWPGSRTMQHLCVIHSDTVHVDDALTSAAATFARTARRIEAERLSTSDERDAAEGACAGPASASASHHEGAGAAAAAARVVEARAAVRLALGRLTDAMVGTLTAACEEMWATAPKGCWAGAGGGAPTPSAIQNQNGIGRESARAACSSATAMVAQQLLRPLRRSLAALDPRTAATLAPLAASAAMQGLLTRVLREGKGGVRASKGGAARLAADVEALMEAADIDGVAASAAEAGVAVGSRPGTPAASGVRDATRGGGGLAGAPGARRVAAGEWTDDATAGAGATALSAWRSVARRARAVVALAEGGGKERGEAPAGVGLADVEEWRRVCAP